MNVTNTSSASNVAGDVLGYLAGGVGTSATLLQLYKSCRKGRVDGVSVPMFVAMIVADILWMGNGLLLNNPPVLVWNIVGILLLSITVCGLRIIERKQRMNAPYPLATTQTYSHEPIS